MPRNAALFVWFRVFFNARFYYPVLAVLFVDLGLTVDQYAMLNVAWAVAIVLFELPLGALGDQIGRKPLVVGAAAIMVVEMCVLAFAPTGDPTLLFWIFLVNRALSGIAEAACSGADEALAYDALAAEGRESEWPRVLSRLTNRMAVFMAISMIVGGAVYDPAFVESMLARIGITVDLAQETTARFPVYLTLALSLAALATAWRMEEPPVETEMPSLGRNLRNIGSAGAWIVRTRFALGVVLFAFVIDTSIRLFLTFSSVFYRLIGIPAALFGVLGAATSALGMLVPPLAERLIARARALTNFGLALGLALAGLFGAAYLHEWWGVFVVVPLAVAMRLQGYFTSHYLNACAESHRRATILSFRSLANNVAYGAAGWGFAILMRVLAGGTRPPSGTPEEVAVFARALVWIPLGVLAAGLPLVLWAARVRDMRDRGMSRAGTS